MSLPAEDVAFLDEYARRSPVGSRSAAVHRAIAVLKSSQLGDAYAEAWDEWARSGEQEVWETTPSDGLAADASR